MYGAQKGWESGNVLVNPIDKKEEIQIVLKRYLERIVLKSYEKQSGLEMTTK